MASHTVNSNTSPTSKQLQPKLKLVQVGNYKLMSVRLGEGVTAKVELAYPEDQGGAKDD